MATITAQTSTSTPVSLVLRTAWRSAGAIRGLVDVAGMGVRDGVGPAYDAMENGRLGPLSGEQVEAHDVVKGRDAVAPGDLLSRGVVAAVVRDGHLVDAALLTRDLWR